MQEAKPNGDRWYIVNILETCGNLATYRNISYYVIDYGTPNEAAYYSAMPMPSLLKTDSDVLSDEILSDPLGLNYKSMTKEQQVASLNAIVRQHPGNVRFVTLRTVLNELPTLLAMEVITILGEVAKVNPVVKLAWDMLQTYSEGGGLDVCSGPVDIILGQLRQQKILTDQHIQAILSMRYTSRAKELVGRDATIADVPDILEPPTGLKCVVDSYDMA